MIQSPPQSKEEGKRLNLQDFFIFGFDASVEV